MEIKKKKLLDTLKGLAMLEKDKKEFVEILCEDNIIITPPTDTPTTSDLKLKYYKIDIDKATELGYYADGQIADSMFELVMRRGIMPTAYSIHMGNITEAYRNLPAAFAISMGFYKACSYISIFETITYTQVSNGVKQDVSSTYEQIFEALNQGGIDASIFIEITEEEFKNPF
jgi:hypothetical protein